MSKNKKKESSAIHSDAKLIKMKRYDNVEDLQNSIMSKKLPLNSIISIDASSMELLNIPKIDLIDGHEEVWAFIKCYNHEKLTDLRRYLLSNYGRIYDIKNKIIIINGCPSYDYMRDDFECQIELYLDDSLKNYVEKNNNEVEAYNMSKNKKKENKREKNIVEFGGKLVKMKKCKNVDSDEKTAINCNFPILPCTYLSSSTNISNNESQSIDKFIMESYKAITREKMIPSEKTGFCREYRKKSLVISTFLDFTNPVQIAMRMAYKLILDHSYFDTDIVPKVISTLDSDIRIEEVKGKFGCFKLTKDSEPFYQMSKQMSNYILNNCAAIFRIMTFRNDYNNPLVTDKSRKIAIQVDRDKIYGPVPLASCFSFKTAYKLGKLISMEIEDENLIEWKDALDIRKATYGDMETLLFNIDDEDSLIFYFHEQDRLGRLNACFALKDSPKFISSNFGLPVYIITNPFVLYYMNMYGVSLEDLKKYDLIDLNESDL